MIANVALLPVLLVALAVSEPRAGHERRLSGMGWENQSLPTLKTAAERGDKRAQLELGIRYEEGRGVTVDMRRARDLYLAASKTTPAEDLFYSSGVSGGPGRVVRVTNPLSGEGLPEAQARLDALKDKKRIDR